MEMISPYVFIGLKTKEQREIESLKRGSFVGVIIKTICNTLEIEITALKSSKRTRELSEARSIAIGLILDKCPDYGLKRLGKVFNRDHSTILYQREMFSNLYTKDKVYTRKVNKVLAKL